MILFVYNLFMLFATSSVDTTAAIPADSAASSGKCRTYTNINIANTNAQWYCYNSSTHICKPVEGKLANSGNPNCFPTVELCYWHCRAHSDCLLRHDSGSECKKPKKLAYYYDTATRTCTLFLYKGCGGNFNRFRSLHDCQVICRGTPCVTIPEVLPEYCDVNMPFYYYSDFSGKCVTTQTCNRRGSNYKAMTDCQESCILKIPVATATKRT
uniref:Putative bovine pancreatic trypsin inhibitor n=1 Tax=Rhipicephalus microplus TaxID=6941 RepID=A0A6G5AA53_RHIMP